MEMNRLVKELMVENSKITHDLAKEIFDCEVYVPKELASYK
jgi:hypothetical protein